MTRPQQLELLTVDPRRDRARQMRRAGEPVSRIKAELGVESAYLVHSWVNDIPPPHRQLRARAKDDVRSRARELRREGKTYTEISAQLGVSKSSCSLWCSDLPRPTPRPGKRRASTWGPFLERRERERQQNKAAAAAIVGALSQRELLLVGTALYWAEGSKDKPWRRRERVTFINSDESIIRVFLEWLRMSGVDVETQCTYHVSIHETADDTAAVRHWSGVVGVAPEQFGRTSLKKHKPLTKRQNQGSSYNGCLVINVNRSRILYQQVDGWWRGIEGGADDAKLEPEHAKDS